MVIYWWAYGLEILDWYFYNWFFVEIAREWKTIFIKIVKQKFI